tara:strand:+ start:190 stop:741 length:552 start_codon:yes stop_codon:yes gene_type:complete
LDYSYSEYDQYLYNQHPDFYGRGRDDDGDLEDDSFHDSDDLHDFYGDGEFDWDNPDLEYGGGDHDGDYLGGFSDGSDDSYYDWDGYGGSNGTDSDGSGVHLEGGLYGSDESGDYGEESEEEWDWGDDVYESDDESYEYDDDESYEYDEYDSGQTEWVCNSGYCFCYPEAGCSEYDYEYGDSYE